MARTADVTIIIMRLFGITCILVDTHQIKFFFQIEMKLIVVTTPTFFVEEDKILTALFEEGLDVLHLRKPETPAMYSERLLTLIPDKYHRRIDNFGSLCFTKFFGSIC